MSLVFEKCDALFKDGALFSYPKTRAVDAERKIIKIMFWISMALCAVVVFTPFVERYLLNNIISASVFVLMRTRLVIVSLILSACAFVISKRGHFLR